MYVTIFWIKKQSCKIGSEPWEKAMTYEWKNKRYEGVPDFRCGKSAFRNKYELWTKEGRCLGIFEFIGGMDGNVAINSLQLNPDNVANLLGDAAINAKRVEELEESNENLRQALRSSVEHVRGFGAMIDDRDAEIAALKAKYTPRPMSEAPRDGRTVFLCGHGLLREAHWMPEKERWHTNGWPEGTFDYWWGGWLPADTFKGGDES
jgi:hypothetical protein